MIFGLFTLAVAIFISGVSAFYSVTGLTAIFAAAFWPIVIMGSALEIGKITATVWLHKYWHRAGWQFKAYLIPAIIVLMIITSMGTYGYLAKAHMDQTVTVGDSAAQVAILDEKIATEKSNIDSAKKALQQMDAQVDQLLGRTTDDRGANRAVQVRKQQAKERKNLQAEITQAQQNISALQNERAPLAAQTRKIEAEVGPIKYIAALIYGDNPDANLLERAVRWVIILLVFVFDPLALVLILAAEQTIEWAREDRSRKKPDEKGLNITLPADDTEPTNFFNRGKEIAQAIDSNGGQWPKGWHQEWVPDTEAWPEWDDDTVYVADDGPLTDDEIAEINRQANVTVSTTTSTLFDTEEEFFAHGKEIARELDAVEDRLPDNYASTQAYLKGPVSWFKSTSTEGWVPEPVVEDPLDIPVLEGEEMWAQEAIDNNRFDPQPIRAFEAPATDEAPINPIPRAVVINDNTNQIDIPDTSISLTERPASTGFGTEFPASPQKGDLFLRVDYLPSRLYKWNDKKWIDVNKETADQFAYDEEYIKHLIDTIDQGSYDVDLLSDIEKEQISRYLNEHPAK